MAISFLYFDIGNVLLKFSHRQACEQIAALCAVDAESVWDVLYASHVQEQHGRGELNDRQVYDIFCEATGTQPDFAQFDHAGSAIFQMNLDLLPLVTQLSDAGYRMGLLSNTTDSHWNYIRKRFGLLSAAFEHAVLSFEVGALKPDQKIYEAAIARAGVAPAEIFFTDDLAENVAAARAAGIDAVAYESAQRLAAELRSRGLRFNY